MKKYIRVVGDTNDADYVSTFLEIDFADFYRFLSLIEAIKNFKEYEGISASGSKWTHRHNWPRGEYSPREDLGEKTVEEIYSQFSEDLILDFEEYVPPNIHSIEKIEIISVDLIENLL